MTRSALLVGGSGPTGPHIADGLCARGYTVTVLHRGSHETTEIAGYEHLHADPHFREPLEQVLSGRDFDLVVATYGRLRIVADVVSGHCAQFLAVSGLPAYPGYHEPAHLSPRGMPIGAREDAADAARASVEEQTAGEGFSRKIRDSERHVLARHEAGAFSASIFRYPSIYGPRQVYPREWSVIRRVLDRRRHIILADAGLTISARCAALNAAAYLLAAVDQPDGAAGEIFNVADRDQYTLRQWTEVVAAAAGGSLEVVSLPFDIAGPGRGMFPIAHTDHLLIDTSKAVTRLSYVEPVPAAVALAATVQSYLDNPPEAAQVAALIDTFDYAEEDRVIEDFRRLSAGLAAAAPALAAAHPYAHPKVAGARDHRQR